MWSWQRPSPQRRAPALHSSEISEVPLLARPFLECWFASLFARGVKNTHASTGNVWERHSHQVRSLGTAAQEALKQVAFV